MKSLEKTLASNEYRFFDNREIVHVASRLILRSRKCARLAVRRGIENFCEEV